MKKLRLVFLRFEHYFQYCQKGILGGIAIGVVAISIHKCVYVPIKKSLSIPTSVVDTEKSKEYIYIPPHRYKSLHHGRESKGWFSFETREFLCDVLPAPLASFVLKIDCEGRDLAHDYESPWSVLKRAHSFNQKQRLRAVESIAAYKAWDDAELRTLAQAIDPKTAVGLARTKDVDMRLFLPPPPLTTLSAEEIQDQLRDVLLKLPETAVDICIRLYTSGALELSEEQKVYRAARWVLDQDGCHTRNLTTQEDVELLCLKAIAKHSVYEEHCKIMVENGILQILQRLKAMRPDSTKIQENIVKIISNICVSEQFHPQIFQSGWISLLAEMSKSKHIALRIQASRGLANLDREAVRETFYDGVHVLHPRYRSRSQPEVDVVFVHGLLGGSFYSWRNFDLTSSSSGATKTPCWPESWLPRDFPGYRVMCIDYDTQLTEWMQLCPNDVETRTISYRSRQFLDRLVKAGVGQRPVVWVAHSMGGLIVKQMLADAKENSEAYGKVLKKTKGIVFFSTPHKGSGLARVSNKIRTFLFPSTEVMELSEDSPKLEDLNNFLKNLAQTHNLKILSFGETHSTNILGKLKVVVVSPLSADPGVGEFILANANHLNVCKPSSRQSSVYKTTVDFIRFATKQSKEELIFQEPRDSEFLLL